MADGIGSISLQDRFGKNASMKFFMKGGTVAKVKTFSDFLKGHCDAKIIDVAFTEHQSYADSPTAGKYDDVEQSLIANFHDGSVANAMARSFKVSIPAPAENCFADTAANGQRIESDFAEDLKDAVQTLTGRTGISIEGGHLRSKKRKNANDYVAPTGI